MHPPTQPGPCPARSKHVRLPPSLTCCVDHHDRILQALNIPQQLALLRGPPLLPCGLSPLDSSLLHMGSSRWGSVMQWTHGYRHRREGQHRSHSGGQHRSRHAWAMCTCILHPKAEKVRMRQNNQERACQRLGCPLPTMHFSKTGPQQGLSQRNQHVALDLAAPSLVETCRGRRV